MNHKKFIIISFLSLLCFLARAQAQAGYQPGEELEFVIRYGFIVGGKAVATLRDTVMEGKNALVARMVAKSAGIADYIYRVLDVYETSFDPITVLPIKSTRDISEGDYKRYEEVTFYHSENYIINTKNEKVEVPKGTIDMVTAFYKIRRNNYNNYINGQIIDIDTYFDNEVFPFDIRYRGIETIKTGLGEFECIKFVPFVEPGRIFETEDDMTIWVTNDKNLIPVRFRLDLLIGSIKCDLVSYKNLKYPLSSLIK